MESQPLNLAHQLHRRANIHLRNNRYDEAVKCHNNAAELLLEAKKCTTSTVASESLILQHNYHLKQIELLKDKKELYNNFKKALENINLQQEDIS